MIKNDDLTASSTPNSHNKSPALEVLAKCLNPWLFNIVKLGYSQYDESHGYDHVVKVLTFLKKLGCVNSIEWIAAAVHGIVDEKYANFWSMTADELRVRIREYTSTAVANIVMNIITNMSWSDEMAGLNHKLSICEDLRQRVQFADWMTSIGRDGLLKSFQYNTARGHPNPAQAVVDLFTTSLSKYVDYPYTTEQMHLIARELHAEMLGSNGEAPTAEYVQSLV